MQFVPARFARDALIEAADAGVRVVVCVTENIPVRDMTEVTAYFARCDTLLIGPNGPGVITPGRCSAGIMPAEVFRPGSVGVVSRSGTLTYEVVHELTQAGFGQSTAVGMGGDPIHGLGFIECLEAFEADDETEAIVLIGEIGGDDEERAARLFSITYESRSGLHRGLQCASGQAHGARRRHRRGLVGHSRSEESETRGGRNPCRLGAARCRVFARASLKECRRQ